MSTNHKNNHQFRTLSLNKGGLPVGVLPNIEDRMNSSAYEPRKVIKNNGSDNSHTFNLRSKPRYQDLKIDFNTDKKYSFLLSPPRSNQKQLDKVKVDL